MPPVAFTVFVPAKGLFISFLDRCEDLAYTAAHRGTVERPTGDIDAAAWVALLDVIYADGNGMGEGDGFTVARRSMSVGDVVTLDGGGTWICDSIGWRALSPEESARFALDAETCPPRTFDPVVFAEQYHPAAPLPSGLMAYVRRSDIGPDAPVPTEVAVAGTCRVTGDFYALEHVPLHGLGAWIGGTAIQHALPGLSPAERNFVACAIRPGALGGPR
jgi:hypothetical protein